MTDLQTLFEMIERLEGEELRQVKQFVAQQEARLQQSSDVSDVEERIAGLHAALEKFREGLTPSELETLIEAMRVKYVYPMKDLAMYDWLDRIPEDER